MMNSQVDKLQEMALFKYASVEALRELVENSPSHIRMYKAGDIVALQGSAIRSLLILTEGSIRAQMTNAEGKRLTMDTIEAPDLLASAFIYSTESKLPVTIEAIEPSTILHLDKEYFLSYMSRHTSVMRAFLALISDRSSFLSQKINALNLQSLRERLINYFRKHNTTIGKQEDLALLMGVARPSLARLLGELVEEGILYKDSEGYHLR